MSAISNSPSRTPFTQFTEHQLLVMLLVEARIQTRLHAQEYGLDEDLDQLRVQVMNDGDFFADPQGATGA